MSKQEEEEEAICLLMKSLAKKEYSHRDEILKKRADAEIEFFLHSWQQNQCELVASLSMGDPKKNLA